MDYFIGIDFCSEVNGYRFVDGCMQDLEQASPKEVQRLRSESRHLASCKYCKKARDSALEEYQVGNSEFDLALFRKSLSFLEKNI